MLEPYSGGYHTSVCQGLSEDLERVRGHKGTKVNSWKGRTFIDKSTVAGGGAGNWQEHQVGD